MPQFVSVFASRPRLKSIILIVAMLSFADHFLLARAHPPDIRELQNQPVIVTAVHDNGRIELRSVSNPGVIWRARLGGTQWDVLPQDALNPLIGAETQRVSFRLVVDPASKWWSRDGAITAFLWDDPQGRMLNAELLQLGVAQFHADSAAVYTTRLREIAAQAERLPR